MLKMDHARDIGLTQIPQSTITPVWKGLLIYFLTFFKGVPLSAPSIPSNSMLYLHLSKRLLMSLVLSMVSLLVMTSTYGL